MDPDTNASAKLPGFWVDFIYNYEIFDAEAYGNEAIKKFSGIISSKITLRVPSTNAFTFNVQTTQLNDQTGLIQIG